MTEIVSVCDAVLTPPSPPTHTHPCSYLERSEPFDRGFYAGPFGWVSGHGAEFAVAIRSAMMPTDTPAAAAAAAAAGQAAGAAGLAAAAAAAATAAELEAAASIPDRAPVQVRRVERRNLGRQGMQEAGRASSSGGL